MVTSGVKRLTLFVLTQRWSAANMLLDTLHIGRNGVYLILVERVTSSHADI